jgi:hypothetical protein
MTGKFFYDKSRKNLYGLSTIIWYFKQLFPLTYRSRYCYMSDSKNGKYMRFAVWQMWFGFVFNYDDVSTDGKDTL